MKRTAICSGHIAAAASAGISLVIVGIFLDASSRAAGDGKGFQPYKDATAGFALAKPDGWKVRTQGLNIWVESPDRSELVLTRAFTPAPGQSANDWLQTLGTQYDKDFPQAALDHAQHVQTPTSGDEIIADAHYEGPKGAAKMRLLCRIVNGKGWLYAFAAPEGRYRAEQPKMLHVAQSIAFFAPKGAGKSSGGGNGSGSGGTMTAAQSKAIERDLHFVTWTEPTEHAYTLSIPQGWKVQSTMYREPGPMPNFFYNVSSPGGDIALTIGTPHGLSFAVPNQRFAQMGMQEGQNNIMHYMRAPEFNEFCLRKIFGSALSDIKIEASQENPQLAQQIAAHEQGAHMRHEVSAGVTVFTAIDKKAGKKVMGLLMSTTTTFNTEGSDLVTWYAYPQLVSINADDTQTDARLKKAMVAFGHVYSSFSMTPKWFAQENAEAMRKNDRDFKNMLQGAKDHSAAIAANSRANSDRLMINFQNHEAAVDESHRGFMNYLGNRTDVTDGAGHNFNVAGGSSHYYQGSNGTIVGTNSAYSPGVDFTPMKEY